MKKIYLLLMIIIVLVLSTTICQATIIVSFDPNPAIVSAGESFELALKASIPTDEFVRGFGLDIIYDHSFLSLVSVDAGWQPPYTWSFFSFTADRITGQAPNPGQYGDVPLATFHFMCLKEGVGSISLVGALNNGEAFSYRTSENLTAYRAWSFTAATVDPENTAAPEPTTMLLLGSGLIGLAGYGRKKFFKK